ncbi:TetR/AcrR family transcriptional regulator [Nocardia harenae]|uniref:TetR/AcrR family transcriptional regulator n=1 Tax=Nocardia harenae TaxID=358707 RepID=UPI000A69DD09|nr:TetR/AcrR family transcriptional regulator [Nocardia harenae]
MATAIDLFHSKGYRETSLGDIAEVIGFTKPAIYYYFKGKEDILFEIVDSNVDAALSRIRAISGRGGSPAERLYDLLVANTVAVLGNLKPNTIFYSSRGMLSPEREHDIRQREREYTRVVRDLYAEGVAAGELLDVDPAVATSTLLGASIWSYTWFDPEGRLPRDRVAEEIARLLMSGFRR